MNANHILSEAVIALLILIGSQCAFSSVPPPPAVRQDTLEADRNGIIFIPALFYTPETGIAGGASGLYYYRSSALTKEERPSTISPTFIYTQKDQVVAQLYADLYFNEETYLLSGGLGHTKFPDKFYGVGNRTPTSLEEDYTPRTTLLFLSFQKKIRGGLRVGVLYDFAHTAIVKTEEDGLLIRGDIPGSRGSTISGTGPFANIDTRNNLFFPSSGRFYQVSATLFRSAIGSDYGFTSYIMDLREYFSPHSSDVLAVQLLMNFMNGNPPFQRLSKIGGQYLMRGYYEGRYRDKNLAALQTEYRVHLWRRIGAAAFVGFGEVADRLKGFRLKHMKYSIGWGLRYLFSRDELLNIRLDLGYGQDSSGFYITIGEAF